MSRTRRFVLPAVLAGLTAALLGSATPALAHGGFSGDAVIGGALGGAAGAAVGSAVGGRDGAIVGGALGAATGVVVSGSRPSYYAPPRPAYVYGPPPVVYAPPPPVYVVPAYAPRPVYAPYPYYGPPGRGWGRHEHWRGRHGWRDDD
ncbi:hypothetical protein OTERR_13940 [Oryzomicrobium terrae]|uniref:Glycine zipper domain-containing protein n=1 Tax=Oryzomicrobium terrae TaxID=1735038 RepID=A0A5C1E7G7_9RHOO|nr:hypothetical protein [Oryzomicrobium terrae]QEL64870.1 hypothetical protein OTERR_13940 [Oryzomicrobium terrae]